MPFPRRSLLLLVAASLAFGGCHTFQPVSYDEVVAGQTLRARVSGAWADSVGEIIQKDARVLEGTVVEAPGASVLMEVTVQNELRGIQFESLRQRVFLPREAFLDLELKQFDRGRTIGVVALGVVVVGALVVQQITKDSGGSQLPGGPGPVESGVVRPVFRIRLP